MKRSFYGGVLWCSLPIDASRSLYQFNRLWELDGTHVSPKYLPFLASCITTATAAWSP